MSGLAVIYNRDRRPVDQADIWAMLNAAAYRGPDGMTVRQAETIALGHAKMAVTPEEATEQQPLVSSRTGCMIIADARLDNREELLAKLPDSPSSHASDAELILQAYETWGTDAPAQLLGDFAFAIWDPRRQHLVCARDTSGQRALYYRVGDETFAAASEIHQLLQDPTVPLEPNEERIRNHLVPLNIRRIEKDQAETFYRGIYALPAAHVLVIDRQSLRVMRYWELEPPAELRYRTEDEYADHYRDLLFKVVRARLRSAHPIGVLLSGGLDSSSITCVAQELYRSGQALDSGFISFSSVFGDLDCDERDFIDDIQAKYGFDARYIPFTAGQGWLRFDPTGFQESPNMGASEARNRILGEASRAGVRVLLTGDVADSCVVGSPLVFDSLLRQGRFRELRRRLRVHRQMSEVSLRRTIAMHILMPQLPIAAQRQFHYRAARRRMRQVGVNLLPFWMPADLRQDLTQRHLDLVLKAERERRFSNPSRHAEHQLLSPPEISRYPMPWSVEFWRPFADRRIHQFMLAIPPEQKYAPHPESDEYYAGSKRVVRHAMRGILPDSVRTRTHKTDFGSVFEDTIERQWPLLEATFGPGSMPEIASRGYVDRNEFWRRLELLRAGLEGEDFMYLMHVVGLETWLRALKLPRERAVHVPPIVGNESMIAASRHDLIMSTGGDT